MPPLINNKKIAVIGGGISGIAAARLLAKRHRVVVFEQHEKIGGLIRCDDLPEGLYHKLGGHVFNTRVPKVADWFWSHFDRSSEFHLLTRNAHILFNDTFVGYPIENHLYQLSGATSAKVILDLLSKARNKNTPPPANFREALLDIFGATLCETYFFPYNQKIWRTNLSDIPIGWLEGKLPMPTVEEILNSNIQRVKESEMVHAKFYYAKSGGSQFIIDRLAEGLDVRLSYPVDTLARSTEGWIVNGEKREVFDWVISSGDVRRLGSTIPAIEDIPAYKNLRGLKTRGITNVFCECDYTDMSWLYLPEARYAANRIIYTGAFSSSNNRTARMTCVVEFVFGESNQVIERDLRGLPGNLRPIATNHVRDAYVIQEQDTRECMAELKNWSFSQNLALIGRFAEWEYYNIDRAIEAAMMVNERIT